MAEFDVSSIGKKATIGAAILISRTAILQIVALGATFLLTIILTPEVFGIFFIVSAVVAFLNYFSDIGLAAALIQKKEELTDRELKTTFTLQQILVGLVSIIALSLSDIVGHFYNLNTDGIHLFQALVLSFILSSLKTIPSVILERKLAFDRLVIPQLIETVIFYALAVTFAFWGYGITSFTIAVLARGVVGLVAVYVIAPWKPGFGIDSVVARRLLSFGIPFQLNSFLALAKDDLFTLYLGKVLPFSQIGYIGWAKKWAEVPLRLVMDNIVKVTFPAYARLQHDQIALRRAIERALFFLSLLTFPIMLILIFSIKPVIAIVPRYGKWEPALLSFYLFTISATLSTITSPLINLLNSIGKVKITLGFMIFWTIMTWILIPFLLQFFGFNSMALGLSIISLSIIFVIKAVRRFINFSVASSLGKPFIVSLPLGIYLIVISLVSFSPWIRLIFIDVGGILVWLLTMYSFCRDEIDILIKKIRHEG